MDLRFPKKTPDLNSELSKTLDEEISFFFGSFNLNITLWKINSGAIGGSIIYYKNNTCVRTWITRSNPNHFFMIHLNIMGRIYFKKLTGSLAVL